MREDDFLHSSKSGQYPLMELCFYQILLTLYLCWQYTGRDKAAKLQPHLFFTSLFKDLLNSDHMDFTVPSPTPLN